MPSHFSSQNATLPSKNCCSNERLTFLWAQTEVHTGQTSVFIFFDRLCSETNIYGSSYAYNFLGTSRFIDDLCTRNDEIQFSSSYKFIYPKQQKLKLEHKGEHATFLHLDITVEDNIFKPLDKRDKFPFSVVFMSYKYSIINIIWCNIFRVLTNSSMYTKTGRFCAEGISNVQHNGNTRWQ